MFLYFSVFVLLLTKSVNCKCEKKLIIICDDLNDYLEYETDNWRQLLIGNDYQRGNWTFLELKNYFLQDLNGLEWLGIKNQLHGEINDEIQLYLEHNKLRHLNFYNNNLKAFYVLLFQDLPNLVELNIVNNNIETIVGDATLFATIKSVDLSRNKIIEIKTNALINIQITYLNLQHNKINNIEPQSFNNSLEILNLNYNELSYLPDESLANLKNLKELTLSHNKLAFIWNLSPFRNKIQKLDFSYNEINSLRADFRHFKQLSHLDFSHNKLKTFNMIQLIPSNRKEKKISIAFNSLTQFQLNQKDWKTNFTAPVTLIFFGNPWICSCLTNMENFMKNRPFLRSQCDSQLFGSGKFPACVQQVLCITFGTAPDSQYFTRFSEVLDQSKGKFPCDIDRDMLNLERKNRMPGISLLPVAFVPSGDNETMPAF